MDHHHPTITPTERVAAFIAMRQQEQRAQHNWAQIRLHLGGWSGQRGNRVPGDPTVVAIPGFPTATPYLGGPQIGMLGR